MTEFRELYRLINPYSHRIHDGKSKRRSAKRKQRTGDDFPEPDIQEASVFDLVYKYLRKCANRDMRFKQRICATNKFQKEHSRRKNIYKEDVPIPRVNFPQSFDDLNKQLESDKIISAKRVIGKKREHIEDYTKAIQNGSKYAKYYLRKALSYGLESGLLIPTDRQNMVRVSRKFRNVLSNSVERDENSM